MSSLRLVETRVDFEALAAQWQALAAEEDRPGGVFRSFAWHRAWLDHFGTDADATRTKLAIVVETIAGRISLIVPLISHCGGGITRLSLMGDPVSQYGDVIAAPASGLTDRIDKALRFAAEQTKADIVSFSRVRGDALLAPLLERQPEWRSQRLEAPYIDFSGYRNVEEFLATQKKSTRKQRKRLRRRLSESAPIAVGFHTPSPQARSATNKIIALKTQTLTDKGVVSRAFRDARVAEFFLDVTSPGSGVDARVATLMSGSTLVAGEIGFREGARFVGHIGVFDPAYHKFAAGHLLQEDVLQACFAEGVHTYDFLAPADDYKASWSNASMAVCDYAITFTTKGYLHREAILKRALPALKWGQKNLPRPLQRLAVRLLGWKSAGASSRSGISAIMIALLSGA